ncbi:flagellar basal-body MS-ring/collar protein FliF [Candidatus Riflebacteria bacterium]
MNPYFKQFRELLSQFVARILALPRLVQVGLGIVTILFLGTFFFFLFQKSTPSYISLFEEDLEIEKAAGIIEKLNAEGFYYRTEKNGKKILVPATDMTKITLKLAELKALPTHSRIGWRELIDNRSLLTGITKDEFNLNFIRGLQTELENGIRQMSNIKNAKVYISKPKEALFKSEQKPTTATIIIKIKPGMEVTKNQVAAMRNLIKGAVEGLITDNITIVDTVGRDLTKALEEDQERDEKEEIDWKYQMQRRKEKDLEDKLKSMLDKVIGFNHTQVRITAQLDFDTLEGNRKRLVPLEGKVHGALVSMKTESEEFEGENFKNSGEPGVNSNTPPGAPSYPADKDAGNDRYARDAVIENYENSMFKEKYKKSVGTIRQLSISVICDWQGTEELKEQLAKAAKAAVGFNKKRGDSFSFITYPFSRDFENQLRADIDAQKSEERLVLYATIMLLGLFPLACLIIYLILRSVKQRELYRAQMAEKKKLDAEARKKAEKETRRQEALFPEAIADPERQRAIHKLKLKAFRYALNNESEPENYDDLTPEEKEFFKMAFETKREGRLDAEIQKLEKMIGEMDKAIKEQREFDLRELEKRAEEKKGLEERIKDLVETRPDDVAKVVRYWIEEEG